MRAGPGSAFDINIVETKIYQWETLAAPPPSPRYNFLKAYHLIIMLRYILNFVITLVQVHVLNWLLDPRKWFQCIVSWSEKKEITRNKILL